MKVCKLLFLAAGLTLLLAACAPATPAPAAPDPTRESGLGAISGQIPNAAELWPDEEVTVYAAAYTPVGGGGGMYTLEPYKAPQALVAADGSFYVNNISPGRYVLVIGPEPARARLAVDETDKARVFEVTTDVIQAGQITLAR